MSDKEIVCPKCGHMDVYTWTGCYQSWPACYECCHSLHEEFGLVLDEKGENVVEVLQ